MPIHDYFISKKNMEKIPNLTLVECFEKCVSRTDYMCLSLEYQRSSLDCFLQNSTVLDFPERWTEDKNHTFNVSYYQRDCL